MPYAHAVLHCQQCQVRVTATHVGEYSLSDEDSTLTEFGLFRCPDCGSPLLGRRESFQIVVAMDRVIGTKGEQFIRIVVDVEGKVVTWFPQMTGAPGMGPGVGP